MMKKIHIMIVTAIMTSFTACNHAAHNHEEEGHNHAEESEHEHTEGENHNHEKDSKEKEGEHNPDEIVFTQAQAKAVNLKVETIKPTDFHQVIRTSGKIEAATGDEQTIVATTNGVVSFVGKASIEGTAVAKGAAVVTLSAKNILDGDPSAKAKIAFETARKEYQRAKELVKDKIISAKEYEQARMNFELARTAYKAQAGNMTAGGTTVTSPMGGYIKNILVKQGDYVTVGQPIATVSQNKRLQLKADVAESDFGKLRSITGAHFATSYNNQVYKLAELEGRMISFGKASEQDSYYIPITFEFNNIGDIIPGSYVEVYLLGKTEPQAIAIPTSALTEEQGINFVYVQVEPDAYMKREVKVMQSDGDRVKVLAGLKAGEKVVTQGALQVKLASASSAIPAHNHEH